MKIALLEDLGVSDEYLEKQKEKLEEKNYQLIIYKKADKIEEKINQVKDADAIILANTPLEEDVIKQANNLKFIDVAFTGVDHIPTYICHKKNIVISNASGYATHAVSELCVGFMIDLLRNIKENEQNCRTRKTKSKTIGNLLHGKTVGIIGAGKIGREVARILKAFGCYVIAYNRSKIEDENIDKQTSLDELLKESDIVTIHCPLTKETEGLIGKKEFDQMKKSAILINTARGKIVNNEELAKALNDKSIAGAGIDVFDKEPPIEINYPLFHSPNVIVSPHIGYETVESLEQRADIVFDNLYAWIEGSPKNQIK